VNPEVRNVNLTLKKRFPTAHPLRAPETTERSVQPKRNHPSEGPSIAVKNPMEEGQEADGDVHLGADGVDLKSPRQRPSLRRKRKVIQVVLTIPHPRLKLRTPLTKPLQRPAVENQQTRPEIVLASKRILREAAGAGTPGGNKNDLWSR
jgi:hypothetical protein